MKGENNVPDITKRIEELYSVLRRTNSPKDIGKKINDVLIYADKVSMQLILPAWEHYAIKKGAKTS